MFIFNGAAALETPEFVASRIDEFGTPSSYSHFAVGWAHAMDTPYQWTKQVASHWGGTRNGTIVHWPSGFEARGEVRSQFHHVIDVAPTVLEAAGLPHPTTVDGVEQHPIEGTSMVYSFDGATEADRRETQYFEMFCNRGIYHQGWTAVTRHSTPWMMGARCRPSTTTCGSSTIPATGARRTTARRRCPRSLQSFRRSGSRRRGSTTSCPLDDRRIERFNADLVGRPVLVRGNSQILFGGMGRLSESSVLNVKNKSHAVTAEVVVPEGGAQGVIIAQGGAFARLEPLRQGRQADVLLQPARPAALQGRGRSTMSRRHPPGAHGVRLRRRRARQGRHSHAVSSTGTRWAQGRVEGTVPMVFSGDETTDVGSDTASPVSDDYGPADNAFNGRVKWVQIDLGEDAEDADHLITPEERLRVAMARQ